MTKKKKTVKRRPHSKRFEKPSRTRQSFAAECDINRIVDRFTRTGMLPPNMRGEPQYGHAPETTFYEAACIQAELRSQDEERKAAPQETASEAPEEPETPPEVPEDTPPEEAAQDESSG